MTRSYRRSAATGHRIAAIATRDTPHLFAAAITAATALFLIAQLPRRRHRQAMRRIAATAYLAVVAAVIAYIIFWFLDLAY